MSHGNSCGFIFCATLLAFVALGCGPAAEQNKPAAGKSGPAQAAGEAGHSHAGWWCTEHGVPEGECGQCDPKLAAQFQKDGDWCKEHDRPDSQCFVCHPEHEAKFAAKYEAKYGEKPPKMN
jgi:hypothetical protein